MTSLPFKELSRRGFLLAGTAAILGASQAQAKTNTKRKQQNVPRRWTFHTNVLVVGAGGAGLAAAAQAAEDGASVLVIDSARTVGGNTAISDGCFAMAATPNGDTVGNHIQQTLETGGYQGNPALVKVLCEGAPKALEWIRSLGLRFKPGFQEPLGAQYPRCVIPNNRGLGFVNALKGRCDALDVQFKFGLRCVRVIRDGLDSRSGWTVGVEAVTENNEQVFIHATRGVILAAGGFAANKRLMAMHAPAYTDLPVTGFATCETGSVLMQAYAVGAYLTGMEGVECSVAAIKRDGTFIRPSLHLDVSRCIFTDASGNRFIREDAPSDALAAAVMRLPLKQFYVLIDKHGFWSMDAGTQTNTQVGELTGDVAKSRTVTGLARILNIEPSKLEANILDFNNHVRRKEDAFGRRLRNLQNLIDEPPYWAAKCALGVQTTLGGIAIDTKGHVLSASGEPIPGLYAAGEITGGIHGRLSLAGNTLADAIVFGRITGFAASRRD